jgi:hypothetical protein
MTISREGRSWWLAEWGSQKNEFSLKKLLDPIGAQAYTTPPDARRAAKQTSLKGSKPSYLIQ